MTSFLLALKRLLRKRGVLPLLLLFPLSMAGVSLLLPQKTVSLPSAGIYCEDIQPQTCAFVQQLCSRNDDFVFFEKEQALRDGVRSGSLDCGFFLSEQTEAFLTGENPEASVRLLTSPLSLRAEVFRQRFSAALIARLSPQICQELLQKYGVDAAAEELSQLIQTHALRENRFHIQLETITGVPSVTDAAALANRSFLWGIVSLFLFACAAACASLYSPASLGALRLVTQEKALWRCVVFPELAAQGFCMAAFCMLGYGLATLCGARFTSGEWGVVLCYTIFLTGLTPALSAVFSGDGVLRLIPPVLCLSLFLCPILIDLSAYSPALGLASALLAPHAFFSFMRWGLPGALLCSAVFLLLGPALLRLRLLKKEVR